MRLEEALTFVKRFVPVPMGKFAKREVEKTPEFRHYNLTRLRPVHDGAKPLCCWCNEKHVSSNRIKYCSDECQDTALLMSNSRSQAMRAYILIELQQCSCKQCGESFEREVTHKILAHRDMNERYKSMVAGKDSRVTYFQIGAQLGRILHIDHIVPIGMGGHGTDISNLQVLCVRCHNKKTREEHSEIFRRRRGNS